MLAIAAIALAASYARPVLYAPRNEAYYMSRPNFTDGTSSMGNSFSTIWTGWKKTRPDVLITVAGGRVIREKTFTYADHEWTVSMGGAGEMSLATLYFPGWKAVIDTAEVPIDYERDGTIRFRVPYGTHTVRVRFTETPVRIIADALSVASLAVLAFFGYTWGTKKRDSKQ